MVDQFLILVINIYAQLTFLAMATKFEAKWATNQLAQLLSSRSLHLSGVFEVGPLNAANQCRLRPVATYVAKNELFMQLIHLQFKPLMDMTTNAKIDVFR